MNSPPQKRSCYCCVVVLAVKCPSFIATQCGGLHNRSKTAKYSVHVDLDLNPSSFQRRFTSLPKAELALAKGAVISPSRSRCSSVDSTAPISSRIQKKSATGSGTLSTVSVGT